MAGWSSTSGLPARRDTLTRLSHALLAPDRPVGAVTPTEMTMPTINRLVLAVALVAHGLGNAVVALRGVDWIGPGIWSTSIATMYSFAIVGFVAAGLGVLGVRPLRRAATASAAAAAVCSLISLATLQHTDLWTGVVLSLVLPVWTAFSGRRDERPISSMHPRWRAFGDFAGIGLLVWITGSAVIWPITRTWGATEQEWALPLPGDDPVRQEAFELLHAVSIDAPPSAVWPWLIQIGQDRAGFYSYERLERLFGVDIHNVREIRPEWQVRVSGERVPATQAGYAGGLFGDRPGWTVSEVRHNEALVLDGWGAFVLIHRQRAERGCLYDRPSATSESQSGPRH
jgi:hypothetical protein